MRPAVIYVLILSFCSVTLVFGAAITTRYWRSSGALMFIGLCFSTLIYAVGYSFEVTSANIHSALFWSRIQYIGVPFIPTFLLLFVAQFVNSGRSLLKILVVLSFLVSTVVFFMRQTNGLHSLFYSDEILLFRSSFSILWFVSGPWYWIMTIYNAFVMLFSVIMTVSYIGRAPKLFRRQGVLILIGILMPIVPYAIYLMPIVPFAIYLSRWIYQGLDLMPLALTLGAPFLLLALLRHNFFTLAPVGRERVVESMSDAVFVLDQFGRIADANPAALSAFSEPLSDVIGSTIAVLFPEIADVSNTGGGRIDLDGKSWDFSRTDIPEEGGHPGGILLVGRDISERERLIRRLELMARIDGLTSLLNRHSWESAARTELSRLSRYKRYGSVVLLDLDHFKAINDSYGHAVGDEVLVAVSRVLSTGVRQPDSVARYGGEEFIIFMPEAEISVARDAAERLRGEIESIEVHHKGFTIKITASFGVSGGLITNNTSVEELVGLADKAMYKSKEEGRNRVNTAV